LDANFQSDSDVQYPTASELSAIGAAVQLPFDNGESEDESELELSADSADSGNLVQHDDSIQTDN
jgi:hypothetical protein